MRPGELGAFLCLLFFMPWSALPSFSQLPTPGQDWVIDTYTHVENETIWMDRNNITVKAGGTLDLRNVSVNFNFTHSDGGGICVESGGTLKMDGCGFNKGVTDTQEAEFIVYGTVYVNNTDIMYTNGVHIREAQAIFNNTWFTNFHYYSYAIDCEDSNLTLRNCRLDGSGGFADGPGIYSQRSNLNIDGCRFYLNSVNIVSHFGETATISNSIFARYFRSGMGRYDFSFIDLHDMESTIVNCTIGLPSRDGVEAPAQEKELPRDGLWQFVVRGCKFTGCENGVGTYVTYPLAGHIGIEIVTSEKNTTVIGCRFNGLNYGIGAFQPDTALLENNNFTVSNNGVGIAFGGPFDKVSDCLIRNNVFLEGQSISASKITFENNTIRSAYEDSNFAISCYNSARILNNTISTSGDHYYYYGIHTSFQGGNVVLEVSGNNVSNVMEGISAADGANTGTIDIRIENNSINSTYMGMYFNGYVYNQKTVDLKIAGNNIRAIEGIEIYWYEKIQFDISDNYFNTSYDGIRFNNLKSTPGSNIANNTFRCAEQGIFANDMNIAIRSNTFIDVMGTSIWLIDVLGDVENNTFVYSNDSFNHSIRVERDWSIEVLVFYDQNYSLGEESWVLCTSSYLRAVTINGYVVLNKTDFKGVDSFVVPEYSILWNGTRNESGPYTFMASNPNYGVARGPVDIPVQRNISLYLRKGPDLLPISLGFENGTPIAGDFATITADILNDGTNNPDNIEMPIFMNDYILDGARIAYMGHGSVPPDSVHRQATLWRATPGWHNITIIVDALNEVREVFEDNNEMTISFFVAELPTGDIISNGTDFQTWTSVDFTVAPWPRYPDIQDFKFSFGDDTESEWLTAPNASHSYDKAGTYTVSVKARTHGGQVGPCFNPREITVRYPEPILRGNASNPAPFAGQEVLFQANISTALENVTSCTWTFGDGVYVRGRDAFSAAHAFLKVGNYKVTLEVEMDWGMTVNWSVLIRVQNTKPTASISVSSVSGTVVTLFEFASVSDDTDGTIAAYNWSLGDGNRSSQPRTSHSYSHWGTYLVSLSVRDDLGEWSDTAYINVTVNNLPPTIGATVNRYSAQAETKLSFDASGSRDPDGNVSALAYMWDFGDGASGRGPIVRHAFGKPGKYTVPLSIMDDGGLSSGKTFTITITERLAAPVGDWLVPAALGGIAILVVIAAILAVRYRAAHPPPPKLRPRPVKTVRLSKPIKSSVGTKKGNGAKAEASKKKALEEE